MSDMSSTIKKPVVASSCDIFENLSKENYKRARSLVINCILSTDMSKHFKELGKFKARIGSTDLDPRGADKDMII